MIEDAPEVFIDRSSGRAFVMDEPPFMVRDVDGVWTPGILGPDELMGGDTNFERVTDSTEARFLASAALKASTTKPN